MIRTLSLIPYLFIINFGLSQNPEKGTPVPMTKMVMKQWSSDQGLISNNLTSVGQTDDGFIWITTFNGTHRFDGETFKLFDKENVDFLKTNAFYSVTNDENSVILASQGSGLMRYIDGKLVPMNEFPVSSVRLLFVDSKGRYWCGTNNEGLYIRENDKTERVNEDFFDQVGILDIYEDSKGRIWIGTEGKGISVFDKGEYKFFNTDNILPDNTITSIIESENGLLLIGSLSGVYVLNDDLTSVESVSGLENVYVNDFVEDSKGMLWVGTERGLFRKDLNSNYLELFDESKGLPSNQVSSVIVDHEGSIWLSTKKSGLVRMNVGSVVTLGKADGITSTRINVIEENDESVYVGSDDGSIFIYNDELVTPLELSTKERQVGIRDFLFDGRTIWIASYLGLHSYRDGKEIIFNEEDGLSSNLIRRIIKTSDGAIWLASRSGGVMKFRNNKVEKIYNTENGLGSNFILALSEDNSGNVVVGTHSGGISIINNDSTITHQLEIGGVVIFNIHVDEGNRYWLSTSIGVFVFDKGVFRKLEFETSFKTEAVFDFIPDLEGNIWLTTNIGIIRIRQKQLNEFALGRITSVTATLFDHNDGMTIRECTGATRSTRLSSGEIWIPTLDGVAIMNPKNIQTNRVLPKVAITSFIVDGDVLIGDNINIEPGKLRFEFEFAATSYLASDRVQYKYQLLGVDNGWITTENNRIEYTNLAPGTYTFSVIGSNNDGLWNEKGDFRSFVVKPFYYQTRVFKIFVIVSIIMIFYFIFVWRVRRVKAINKELSKVNEELDRFVYSASHDIRAPLTSIMGVSHIARESKTIEEKDNCLDMIESSADKLDGFIRDIIDYSRNQRLEIVVENANLKEELADIFDSLKYLDEKEKVECHINCQVENIRTDIRRLRVILKNIIANAFFYYDPDKAKPAMHIECVRKDTNIQIRVSDNGLGIEKEIIDDIFGMFYRGHTDSQGSGLGLYIARENVEKLGGRIDVESKVKEGTIFTIIVPELN